MLLFEPLFEAFELREIVDSDVKVFFAMINKLKALGKRPLKLLHEEGDDDGAGSGLAIDGMHEAALAFFMGLLDEVADGN